ncbi:MAG: hypothetical protein ACM33V_15270 [Chloroflexota bacterium]|nr:hypothetical protein [Anaerolineales bacterium]
MNYLLYSSPFKKGLQIALSLMLGVALLGGNIAYAWGPCVSPSGAGGCYKSIQAAVDAANDGDQIVIRAGKYVEQVTIIGKNLSLIGRRGAIIQAPKTMEDTLSPLAGQEARPIILVAEAEVTVRDLVIDGANSTANNPYMYGVAFINADGVIRGNVVKNVGFGTPTLPEDGSYQGEAIVVVNFGPTPRTVTIAENYVSNYNASGITIFAQGMPDDPTLGALVVNVLNNTVIGSGPNNVLSQWGVFFGGYESAQITGSLKGNWIRDLITIDQYPAPGAGIATKDMTNVEISGNVIENTDMGFSISGVGTQILQNRFKKVSNGVLLFVDFPDYGNAVGTILDDNRFDKVDMDIMTGPVMYETAAKAMSADAAEEAQPKRLPR